MSSAFFPHVSLSALENFAIATAAAEHVRLASCHGRKAPGRVEPKVISCEDVVWGGDKMILITFETSSLLLGPNSMLAHFPVGRPRLTTQALVGMTTTIQAYPLRIGAPKIYAYNDTLPNDIGAEVVLLEKVPGESLEDVWPTLTPTQEFKVCVRLTELLLALFNYRGSLICTDLQGTSVNTRPAPPHQRSPLPPPTSTQTPVLLSRPFDEGPLATMPPQRAMTSTTDYLHALANRINRVFNDTSTPGAGAGAAPSPSNLAARDTGWPENPPLTDLDVSRIKETWKRLSFLIPYHTGGFYIPGTLSLSARHTAYTVLQSQDFGILHSDMQMSRFIVQFTAAPAPPPTPVMSAPAPTSTAPGPTPSRERDVTLTLTGWEHAYRAPLWSCARMPPWLYPRIIPNEVMAWERQRYMRMLIMFLMNDERMLPTSWEWVVAYVYGTTERWFEGCLSSHWMFRDSLEVLLARLKTFWEAQRPDIPFPLPVGVEYVAPQGGRGEAR